MDTGKFYVRVQKPIDEAGLSMDMHGCCKGLHTSLCFDQVTLCINVGQHYSHFMYPSDSDMDRRVPVEIVRKHQLLA